MSHSTQPLASNVTIDPTLITSLTGPNNHTGIYLDADTVNSSILITTNDTDALYIDKYQNVGINNSAPAAQLDINSVDGKCIQLTYNNTANTAAINLASNGIMSLSSTGQEVNVDSASNFNVKSHNGTSAGLKLNNVLVLSTADQINYNTVTPGTASASKALVLDSNKDIISIRNLSAVQLTGTLQTASQPNVTSVSILDVTDHDLSTQGLSLAGTLITASATQINYTNVTQGAASASKALVVDSNKDISSIRNLSAVQLTGTLQTAAQPNITSVGTLQGLNLDGSLTGVNALGINTTSTGRSLIVNNTAGNCIQLCYNTASGTPINYVDLLVSSTGELLVTPSGGNLNITTHDGATQGLMLDSTLVTATADQLNYLSGTVIGSASGGKALIVNSNRNIDNINNLLAVQLTGTLQTAAQPNINSVNTLNIANHNGTTLGLQLGGILITASANEINYVDTTPGSAAASKALVLDSSSDISGINSLSATDLAGTLQTAAQPNITSVGTLTSVTTSGSLTLGSTAISESEIGVLDGVTLGTAAASKALVLDSSLNVSGINSLSATDLTGTLQTADQPNITSVGTLTSVTTSGSLTLGSTAISESEIGVLDGVTPGTVSASKALVVDSNKDISALRNLTATNLTGTLQTAAQPNITSVGTLSSITTSGNLTLGSTTISESEIGVLDSVTPGTASASKALVLDSSSDISGIDSLTATSLTGTIQTAYQPNISSVNVLDVVDHNGTTQGLSLGGVLLTATAAQINSVFGSGGGGGGTGTFTNLTVNGTLDLANADGSTLGLSLANTLVTASGSELNYLDGSTPGTAVASTALVVDSSLNISGINSLSTTSSITIDGVNLTAVEANYIDGVTPGIASAGKSIVLDSNSSATGINSIAVNQLTLSGSVVSYFGTKLVDNDTNHKFTNSSNSIYWLTYSATSPTLQLTISTFTALVSSPYYAISNSPNGYYAEGYFGSSFDSNNTYSFGMLWQHEFSRFIYYFGSGPAGSGGGASLKYSTSTNGINWSNPANITVQGSSASILFYNGTTIKYHAPSGKYVFFIGNTFWYSTNGINGWVAITISNALDTSEYRNNTITLQMLGNYVTHLNTVVSGSVHNVMYWNGTTWSQVGTINTTTFRPIRVYATGEDRLYMINQDAQSNGDVNTLTFQVIDNFSTHAFNTWASAIETVSVSNIKSIGNLSMIYDVNYGVIIAGQKYIDAAAQNTIRIMRLQNKQLTYSFVDGPTESPGVLYKAYFPAIVIDWNNNLVIRATKNDGTINSVYWLASSSSNGISFGSTTITESEIGVLDAITPGTASASKALVIDSSSNISGINSFTATSLAGTLQTTAQPNITSVGTLTNITTSGNLTLGSTIISESEIGVLDAVTPGAASASKALVLNSSSNISGINSLTATSLTGTLQTAAQPNITSVGTLTSITTSGSLTLGSTVISQSEIGVLDAVTPGTASASKALVLDSSSNISGINSLSATSLTGTLQTAAQPNITSVGTLSSIATSGDLTLGATVISESEISVLDGVTPGTATASKALVLDSSSDISGIDSLTATSLTATNLTGTLQTAAQPNITSVGTLSSIATSGDLTLGATVISESDIGVLDGVTPGAASASKALVLDSSSDISGINSLTAASLTGTLQTAAQPNITSVGTLSSISTSGSLTLGSTTITESEIGVLDGVTPGTVSASKALVVDSNKDISALRNLTATNLTGTLQTATQPNITSVGTLTSVTTSGDLTLGSTVISESDIGVLDSVSPGTADASKALVLDSSSDISGINSLSATSLTATNLTGTLQTAAQPNITSVGTLTSVTTSGSLTLGSTAISESEIGVLDGVTPGTATASKALVLDSSSDISGIDSLTATSLTGTLQTAAQPNITSVGTLTSITTSGSLTLGSTAISESEIGVLDGVTPGTATASKALVLDSSSDISGIDSLTATSLAGTLQTAAQPNITSVGTLTSITTSGSLTLGSTVISQSEIGVLDAVTPGTAAASKALVLNSSSNISGINSLSATSLTGTLQTAAQPNITSVGTLTSITTSGSLTLGSTAISESEIGVLDGVTPGTAAASKALVLNSSSDISGVHKISSDILSIGTPANSNLPVEIGYTTYQFSGAYAYNNNLNAHGLVDANGGISANYSLRADGRILVTGEIELTSDRRLKKNIEALTFDFCRSFVATTTPVRFNWRNDDSIPDYGYIAQDVLKAGFNDLVTVVAHPGMEGSEESDGFINPADAKFVFSPGKIVPILALNQKELFKAQDAKDIEIASLSQRLAYLESLVSDLLQKK